MFLELITEIGRDLTSSHERWIANESIKSTATENFRKHYRPVKCLASPQSLTGISLKFQERFPHCRLGLLCDNDPLFFVLVAVESRQFKGYEGDRKSTRLNSSHVSESR